MNEQKNVFVIAEAGVNHNGDMELAKELIDAAAAAGADAVKFQTFKAESLVSRSAPKAAYQLESTAAEESQFEMLRALELSHEAHPELMAYCRAKDIMFLSTPFAIPDVDFLHELGMPVFKIPSGEIVNKPYLRKIGSLGKKIILSSGMSTMEEIEAALDVLTRAGAKAEDLTVLHCTTEYPAPLEEVNLKAMQSIATAFPNITVGYSDHTPGIEVSLAAVALGARLIEKHFTMDKTLPGPDQSASLDPDELKALVSGIRNLEKALSGDGVKRPAPSELKNIPVVRKSIVAAIDIQAGDVFTDLNLTVKRPGDGISPMLWDEVLGETADRNYAKDELIEASVGLS